MVGLIVGMRAGRRISRWGDDESREWGEPEPEGMTPERLAELLDGAGIPTPTERRFIREWLDSHDDLDEEL